MNKSLNLSPSTGTNELEGISAIGSDQSGMSEYKMASDIWRTRYDVKRMIASHIKLSCQS